MSKSKTTLEIEECFLEQFPWSVQEVGIFNEIDCRLCSSWSLDVMNEMITRGFSPIEKLRRKEIIDLVEFNTKGFCCYEIKVSSSDFHSECAKTFIGNYNYYILTPEVYEKVGQEILPEIGVYIYEDKKIKLVKKAKFQVLKIDEAEFLKDILIAVTREKLKAQGKWNPII